MSSGKTEEIDESLMWYHGVMSRHMCDDVLVAGKILKVSTIINL